MSVLRTIERKIEGLFEGVFGRAFRTHVQPVELARKLAKEMDEHRSVSVSRVYVPNEYTVYLSSADRQQFVSYEGSLIGELQEYLTEHARREAYALLTPPRVRFAVDDDLAVGEFGIATRVAQPDEGVPSLPASAPAAAVAARSVSIPDAPIPDAPSIVKDVRVRIFLNFQRQHPEGRDPPILYREASLTPRGAIYENEIPGDIPLFDQLVHPGNAVADFHNSNDWMKARIF